MRKALFALPFLFFARNAAADDTTPPASPTTPENRATTIDAKLLSEAQTTYFLGEKTQGVGWGSAGLVAMGTGVGLFAYDHPFTRGASYPIFIVGAAQTFIAVLSFARPDGRIQRNDEAIAKNPGAWLDEERARIHTVNRFLTGVKILEVATTVTGIALAGAGLLSHDGTIQGVGFGISVQGAAMFVLDAFAHERAEHYESVLALEPPSR